MFSLSGSHGAILIEDSTFKDGQPHIRIPHIKDVHMNGVRVFGRITNADDLLKLQLIVDVLRANNRADNMSLELSYLMGGRMDREISEFEPSTLKVVCDTINGLGFKHIDLFDCHSAVSKTLLRASNHLPTSIVGYVASRMENPVIIIPDAGAEHRVNEMIDGKLSTIQCLKARNPQTRELLDFIVCNPEIVTNRNCLIVDDICDGGRTFIGLAKILKSHGALSVELFVSHGIFSYGYKLEGIDKISTTNSYRDMMAYPEGIRLYEAPFTPIA